MESLIKKKKLVTPTSLYFHRSEVLSTLAADFGIKYVPWPGERILVGLSHKNCFPTALAAWECGSATVRAHEYILIHNTHCNLLTFFFLQPSLQAPVILSKMWLFPCSLLCSFFPISSLSAHHFCRQLSFPAFKLKSSVFIWFFPIASSGPFLWPKKKYQSQGKCPFVGFTMWITFPPFPPQILWCLLKFAGYSFFFSFHSTSNLSINLATWD